MSKSVSDDGLAVYAKMVRREEILARFNYKHIPTMAQELKLARPRLAKLEKVAKPALERIRDKAGSHTVSAHIQGDPTDDPGYSGIYEVAIKALADLDTP